MIIKSLIILNLNSKPSSISLELNKFHRKAIFKNVVELEKP